MESIDFSPFQGQINHMVLQLALILFIPLFIGIAVKFVLVKIKCPQGLANFVAVGVLLFAFYKMVFIVLV
ncbi:hypothetical protein [Bacillus sp. S/N-304-OC-R1]|uniref:hypothetical protein n=1 Tax=Bacillus sp. S/N-304-OC-R1 TaxID=2758034 RepID=UPI001C8D6E1D|nr:hypothetical protein [Bacillus sp. S/N-304-OC-R1]MBY0122169.1 hypothetical protein [Bacillus sp. S/N-304-OC-R1]